MATKLSRIEAPESPRTYTSWVDPDIAASGWMYRGFRETRKEDGTRDGMPLIRLASGEVLEYVAPAEVPAEVLHLMYDGDTVHVDYPVGTHWWFRDGSV